jgi:S-(hydroxymethyl)glutathione dehydrogenase/alcohol dehydrogenase
MAAGSLPGGGFRIFQDGRRLHHYSYLSTFARHAVVDERCCIRLPAGTDPDVAALVGCAVTTGVGAVINRAKVSPGSTVAVFGAGGVGLATIQGARIAGARTIIAVDVHDHKLETAYELGATHTINGARKDPVKEIRDLTDGGVEYSFEAIGLKRAAEQCFECLRAGGTATIIGMIPLGQKIELDGSVFLREKKIQGSSMGSNHFKVDMPKYIDFYMQGRLKLDEMITRRLPLEDLNEAFRAMKAGEVARQVLVFN